MLPLENTLPRDSPMSTQCDPSSAQKAPSRFRRFGGIAVASLLAILIAASAYWYSRRDAVLAIEVPELRPGESVVLELTSTSYCLWGEDETLEFTFSHPGRFELHPKPGDYYATIWKPWKPGDDGIKRGEDQTF